MQKGRPMGEQSIGFLEQAEGGMPLSHSLRRPVHGLFQGLVGEKCATSSCPDPG